MSALQNYLFAFELGPAIVHSVAVIVVQLDDQAGTIMHATPLAAEMFGYTPDEMIGMSVERLIPEDSVRKRHVDFRSEYNKNPNIRTMNAGVYVPALHKDGRIFFVQVSLCPRKIAGIDCAVACLADVSNVYHHLAPTRPIGDGH